MSVQQAPPHDGSAVSGLIGFEHRYAEVNGTRLHYVAGGEGPAIVLLHGWPYTGSDSSGPESWTQDWLLTLRKSIRARNAVGTWRLPG